MNIKKLAAVAAMTSLSGVLLLLAGQSSADTLFLGNDLVCNNISNVSWTNGRLSVACDDNVTNPAAPNPPAPNPPAPIPPAPIPPVISSECGVPEPDVRIERFSGGALEKEFTLANGTALVLPFTTDSAGDIKKITFGEPSTGEHFKKTIIISKCPGVYNPQDYDYRTSVDVCASTGLELSFSVITGQNRADYPISSYRCVLEPNQQYYINVFQYDSGNRPPYVASSNNTCRTNRCGLRVLLR